MVNSNDSAINSIVMNVAIVSRNFFFQFDFYSDFACKIFHKNLALK